MRIVTALGWALSIVALAAMVTGHLGDHGLDWRLNQISTYAARAPLDELVTAAMLASAAAVASVGCLATRQEIIDAKPWNHLAPLLAGAAAAGLVMLAFYEEAAANLAVLEQAGFRAVRQQSFHDAGLQIFFFGSLLLVALLGMMIVLCDRTPGGKILGALILITAPGALFLMTTPWTQTLGLAGAQAGLQQRAALFCLWLALVLFLSLATWRAARQGAPRERPFGLEP